MFTLGLTGGIASGKSTAAAWLTTQGARHIDADRIARQVVAVDTPGLATVLGHFGPQFALPDGSLDRAALGALVFADADRRRALEAIVHPLIRQGIADELAAARADDVQIALVDAALLFELGLDRQCDATLAVVCEPETQIARLATRNGLDRQAAQQRLAAQATRETQRARATWTVDNDGSVADLEAALRQVLQAIEHGRHH